GGSGSWRSPAGGPARPHPSIQGQTPTCHTLLDPTRVDESALRKDSSEAVREHDGVEREIAEERAGPRVARRGRAVCKGRRPGAQVRRPEGAVVDPGEQVRGQPGLAM